MTIEQIKKAYPDEWVLLGNPALSGARVESGEVLSHSKDKRELAMNAPDWRLQYQSAITIFTGASTGQKRYWL